MQARSIRSPIPLVFLAAAFAAAPAVAQVHDHGPEHGFDKLGKVSFPVSCNPEAQKRFDYAMTVIHSFWWELGDNAFSDVLAADPSCSMAWWGIALNAWNNPFAGGPAGQGLARGAEAAGKAGAAAATARTPRERGFLNAAAALYRDHATTTNAQRMQAYADTMARLYRDVPNDTEVAIYRALALVATAPRTDTTFANQKQAAAILNPLYAAHPDHPGLAHYIIHANDSPHLASLGLEAARRYAEIAPSAPHAQHMPSHIFVRLGLWDETVGSNLKSYESGVAYSRAAQLPGVASHEFHALDYAVYGYLQRGQDSAARAAVEVARGLTSVRVYNTLVGGYNRLAMEARIPLERGDWAAAAAFTAEDAPDFPIVAGLAHFTRGIGAARSGNVEAARGAAAALDSIGTVMEGKNEPYWARVARIKGKIVASWASFAAGDTTGGLALAKAAAEEEEVTDKSPVTPGELLPARELHADMLLAAGRPTDAVTAYRATLAREPGRARSVYGIARAMELAGQRDDARRHYQVYLNLMVKADGTRPELAEAKKAVG
ncbi:MAG: bacterial transcriptional activator domain-containing protein [Gemmatimonadales bacterium]